MKLIYMQINEIENGQLAVHVGEAATDKQTEPCTQLELDSTITILHALKELITTHMMEPEESPVVLSMEAAKPKVIQFPKLDL